MRNVVLLIGVLTVGFACPASSQDTDVTALQLKAVPMARHGR